MPVRFGEDIKTVRIVAGHNKNNNSLEVEGDIYDVIVEKENRQSLPHLNAVRRPASKITIAEMLSGVNEVYSQLNFTLKKHTENSIISFYEI